MALISGKKMKKNIEPKKKVEFSKSTRGKIQKKKLNK